MNEIRRIRHARAVNLIRGVPIKRRLRKRNRALAAKRRNRCLRVVEPAGSAREVLIDRAHLPNAVSLLADILLGSIRRLSRGEQNVICGQLMHALAVLTDGGMCDDRIRLIAAQNLNEPVGDVCFFDIGIELFELDCAWIVGEIPEDRLRARAQRIPRLDRLLLHLPVFAGEEHKRRVAAGKVWQKTPEIVGFIRRVRENHHHLGLRLLRGHHAKLVRCGRGVVDAHLGNGILLCGGHAYACAVIGQRVVVVEQIGVCAHALKYRSRSIERFDGSGFRCCIPADIESLRAARELD